MSLGIIPFSKIFLTVLFDTLTNNVSFLFLFLIKHLFKCVALLCIYVIVIVLGSNNYFSIPEENIYSIIGGL
jgi:hypothetical protein